jgi:FemAB family protein
LDFRKSYKPLVNKALKEWDVKVCEENVDEVFEEFKDLHFEAAGKQTRSKESWSIQRKQIENNEAFLVSVRDGNLLIGAGFFNFSRDMGTYSVGAYKRDLFDKPIGHAVQMIAIKQLKI